ncbi:unnamed protein product [Prorocentrum cordatum]|uniref:Mre11 DNA-binding domain-containing protein n=1 Tax=Prorocentrum cordatum TaxID=2364126 RepID=A0ABN9PMY6_9DINO|nr:unnamed protein product [Polarella glacialis]
MLPAFLDLVIQSHDCEVTPRENLQGEFYVVQPGSSVATSLSQGETKLKHIALIHVKGGAFQCVPTPLWTTRPLMFGEVSLSDSGLLRTDTQAIWDHLTSKIDELILQGQEECRARKRELEKRGNGGAPAGGVSAPLKAVCPSAAADGSRG